MREVYHVQTQAYVERLRQELEDKFLELGPDTVIGCKYLLSNAYTVRTSDTCEKSAPLSVCARRSPAEVP